MEMDDDLDEVDAAKIDVDPLITPELFAQWRSPRFGRTNPERMNNPFWEWMIRTRLNAYLGNEKLGGPSSCDAGPTWCFTRFGQSHTTLPDGREIFIAGEHEDFYDSDFFIYNDVIVKHPDGQIDIFGYPREEFPPTDFHTATLDGDKIIIIGSLGYPAERKPGVTQIFTLDPATMKIAPRESSGAKPGWIFEHQAKLSDDGSLVIVTGGQIAREPNTFVDNIDEWELDLQTMTWQRLTARKWPRFSVYRSDQKRNSLWEVTSALRYRDFKGLQELFQKLVPEFESEHGCKLDFGLAATLFRPHVPHEPIELAEDESWKRWAILVNGIRVTYRDEGHEVVITAEGELAPSLAKSIAMDFRDKMSRLENRPYKIREIEPLLT
jgi:hypothetical protein